MPLFVLFGYATALTRIPGDAAAAILGNGVGLGSQVAQLVGTAGLVWLGVITHRGIELHYGVPPRRAFVILIVAVVVFYLVPLVLIVVFAIAILVAAIVLGYVPGL